jgi:lipopolysaccharide/colanic/teichoic acid biosynthesis glycosyltransferase
VSVALALLVLALPIMIVASVAIALDGGRPIIYRQARVGLRGRPFTVLKFRSMARDAEKDGNAAWATPNDARVTRIGRFLRRFRIDEVPQLVNVLRGEMSFVGPRPERRHFVQQLEKEIHYYSLRMSVRPGITGWAQVEYRYGSSVEDALEKLKYDLFYIKNSNFLYDVWILIKTVKVVLTTAGAR